jgi:hypothetical protein
MTSSRKSIKRHIGYLEAINNGVGNQIMRSSKRKATPSSTCASTSTSSSSSFSSPFFQPPLTFAKEPFSHEDEKDVEPKEEEYFEELEPLDRTEVFTRSNGRNRRVIAGNPEKEESLYAEFDLQSPSAQSNVASPSCMSLSTSVAVAAAAAAAFKLPVCAVSTSIWPSSSFSVSTCGSSSTSFSPPVPAPRANQITDVSKIPKFYGRGGPA